MKVYLDDEGARRLVGRADVPDEGLPTYDVPLFGPAETVVERYAVCAVTHLPTGGGPPVVERAIVLGRSQDPALLPGWRPLDA